MSHEEHPCEFYKNTSLQLDSKIASPKIIQHHMRNTPETWGVEKYLDISEKPTFSKEQKDIWRSFCQIRDNEQQRTSKELFHIRNSNIAKTQFIRTISKEEAQEEQISPSIKLFKSMSKIPDF